MKANFENNQKLERTFKQNNVVFAYVFGSQATGKTTYDSDVDIAVYLSQNCKDAFQTRLSLISALEPVFKNRVDVVVLNEQRSSLLKFSIIKEGKVIFEADHSQRVDFELRTMQQYYDYKPFLDAYNKAYLERELAKESTNT